MENEIFDKAKKVPSERAEQIALVSKCRKEGVFIASIPNGAKLGGNKFQEINMLKAEGLLPGMVDLIVLLENYAIFIEMKKQGGITSAKQKLVHEKLEELNLDVQVFYSAKEAWNYISEKRIKKVKWVTSEA